MDPVSLRSPLPEWLWGERWGLWGEVIRERVAGHLAVQSPAGERCHLRSLAVHVCNGYQSYIMPHHATVECSNWICVYRVVFKK